MAFPRRLLVPGEEVVVEAHPNWSVLARATALAVVIVAGCVTAAVWWTSAPSFVLWALLAVGVLAGASYLARLVVWRSRLLVITTVRVVYRSGVVKRTGREIRLDRIQDVRYHQSLLERLAGAGSLTIESAGAGGQEPFIDVRHPAQMQSLINELIGGRQPAGDEPEPTLPAAPRASERRERRSGGRRDAGRREDLERDTGGLADSGRPTPVVPMPAVPPPSRPAPGYGADARSEAGGGGGGLREELRDLERLHEAGVLTDDEFTRKRRQLLGLD